MQAKLYTLFSPTRAFRVEKLMPRLSHEAWNVAVALEADDPWLTILSGLRAQQDRSWYAPVIRLKALLREVQTAATKAGYLCDSEDLDWKLAAALKADPGLPAELRTEAEPALAPRKEEGREARTRWLPCANGLCGNRVELPTEVLGTGEKAKDEFRNSDLSGGGYISPSGFCYCSRCCFAQFCDD